MKRSSIFLIAGILPAFILSACAGPGPMPRGYVHHNEQYKSPAPGPTSKISEAQREVMTAKQARQIGYAIGELVAQLTERAGLAPRPVFVQTADPLPPIYAMIDSDLRDALVRAGYLLSPTPDDAYIFQYDAAKIVLPETIPAVDAGQNFNRTPNVTFTLKIIDGPGAEGRLLTLESGDYYIEGAEVMDIPPARFDILQKAGQ